MILYAIHYNSRPRIRFACATTVETEVPKRNIIDHRKNIIELAYYTGDAFSLQVDETLYPIAQSDIFLIMPDARYEPICGAGKHTITCLAVEIDDLSYDILDSDDPQMLYDAISAADADTVFLPRITQMEDRDFQMLTALFRAAINNYAAGTTPRHLLALSGWYEILSLLDGQVRAWAATQVQTASQSEESSGHLYVRKAKNYICTNFSRRISLAEIAEDMGITEGYLCTVFRRITGYTVVEYLNMLRVQRIRERILQGDDRRLPLICAEAGIPDIRYAQRLFKKYFGVSMYRCRQLDHGISLYHKNPWLLSEIDHDIFNDAAAKPAEEEEVSASDADDAPDAPAQEAEEDDSTDPG